MFLHDKIKFAQLVNIFISFMKSKGSFPCLQNPAHKLEHSPRWASTKPILILSSHQHLGIFSDFVLSQVFRPKYVTQTASLLCSSQLWVNTWISNTISMNLKGKYTSQEGFNFFFTLSAWLKQDNGHFTRIHNTVALAHWRCKATSPVFWSLDWSGFNRASSTVRSSTGLSEIQTMKANKHALYWHWPEQSCFLNWCNCCRTLGKTVTNVVCPPSDNLLIPAVFYRSSNTAIPVRQPRVSKSKCLN